MQTGHPTCLRARRGLAVGVALAASRAARWSGCSGDEPVTNGSQRPVSHPHPYAERPSAAGSAQAPAWRRRVRPAAPAGS